MTTKHINTETKVLEVADEQRVPPPKIVASPFEHFCQSLDRHYNSTLRENLEQVDRLMTEGKFDELRKAEAQIRCQIQGSSSYQLEDGYFTWKEERRGYGYEEKPRRTFAVPFVGDFSESDIENYLIITGKKPGLIPLTLARAVASGEVDWAFCISELSNMWEPLPTIPETAIDFRGYGAVSVNEQRELLLGRDKPIVLEQNWRQRGNAICNAIREADEDAQWERKPMHADLVRCGDKYIWLSLEKPSPKASVCPRLIQIGGAAGEISECLQLWRQNPQVATDSAKRLEQWKQSKAGADSWVAHIAENILSEFAPWPEPFSIRPQTDPSRDWSSEQCLKQVVPSFRSLSKAPLRGTPPNLVKTLLYLIRKPIFDAHAWPGELMESWNFSVRTYDHSWITGEIVSEGHVSFGSSPPLKFEGVGNGYREDEGILISCGKIHCFIKEEKNNRR